MFSNEIILMRWKCLFISTKAKNALRFSRLNITTNGCNIPIYISVSFKNAPNIQKQK